MVLEMARYKHWKWNHKTEVQIIHIASVVVVSSLFCFIYFLLHLVVFTSKKSTRDCTVSWREWSGGLTGAAESWMEDGGLKGDAGWFVNRWLREGIPKGDCFREKRLNVGSRCVVMNFKLHVVATSWSRGLPFDVEVCMSWFRILWRVVSRGVWRLISIESQVIRWAFLWHLIVACSRRTQIWLLFSELFGEHLYFSWYQGSKRQKHIPRAVGLQFGRDFLLQF